MVIGTLLPLWAALAFQGAHGLPTTTASDRAADRYNRLVASLAQYSVQPIALPASSSPPASFDVEFDLDGVRTVAALVRRSMRSPEFQVFEDLGDQVLVAVDPGPVRTYRGTLVDRPTAQVSAYLRADGALSARIAVEEATWYVEPIPNASRRSGGLEHVVYRRGDVVAAPGTCGAGDDAGIPPGQPPGGGPGPRGGPSFFRAQIAFDADFEYFDEYGSTADVVAQIETNMGNCEDIYQRDVGLCWEITRIVVRTSSHDPYSDQEEASALLQEFVDHWNANFTDVPRTTAHLMTGKDLTGSTIGIARVAGIHCSGGAPVLTNAYGLQEDIVIQSRRTELCAHEIGHNWSACHCDQASCGVVEDCGIMTSSVGLTEGRDFFSQFSQNQIESHIAFISGCQLIPCGCGITILIPEFPFLTVETAVQSAPCGSVVSIRTGTYDLNSGVLQSGPGRTVQVQARGGVVRLDRP